MVRSKISLALACAAMLLTAACATTGTTGPGPAPPGNPPQNDAPIEVSAAAEKGGLAVLSGTHVDDEVLRTAWQTLGAARAVSTAMRAIGVVEPGSATANRVADGLDGARRWLNAATEAQRLGEAANAFAAFQQAEAAYVSVLRALGR